MVLMNANLTHVRQRYHSHRISAQQRIPGDE
jgi:hypothetical protein